MKSGIINNNLFLRGTKPRNLIAVTMMCALSHVALADLPWSNWRGPNNSGVADGKKYPIKWSEESGVKWKLELPGRGASTPIVVDKKVIFTLSTGDKNTVWAIDENGKKVWERQLSAAAPGKNAKASGANSSPITDGKHIFVYFKNGEVAALDLKGDVVWSFNIQDKYGEDTLWWDLGTSPILTKDHLVIAVMHSGPSFLLAIDKSNGSEVWKADRWLDVNQESNQAYTTPVYHEGQIVTVGADHVTSHDATSGKELWRVGGLNPENNPFFRSIASPVIAGDLVICPYARGNTLTAIKLEKDLPADNRIAWTAQLGSDVPTPVYQAGRVYNLGDKGVVTCLDAPTGKVLWQETLPRNRNAYSSSPILAGNHLYCSREDGMTSVLDLSGETPKLVGENPLDGQTVATPVFVDGRIYFRTFEAIYCIE
jgi:outer membrane protein assembly factor BamB